MHLREEVGALLRPGKGKEALMTENTCIQIERKVKEDGRTYLIRKDCITEDVVDIG